MNDKGMFALAERIVEDTVARFEAEIGEDGSAILGDDGYDDLIASLRNLAVTTMKEAGL